MPSITRLLAVVLSLTAAARAADTFQPTWDSLKHYQCPDWYRDAKFGIAIHWGICSVPEHDDFYGRSMYIQRGKGSSYDHHLKTYGHPSTVGYKDLIPLWKGEKFDAGALAKLCKKAGAQYVVPLAIYYDNFDLFNSKQQPWNSVNMGPKRDIIGLWKKAADANGLRFGVFNRSDRAWMFFATAHGADTTGPRKDIPYDGALTKSDISRIELKLRWWAGYNPQDLYSPEHAIDAQADPAFIARWAARNKELIEKYKPDLLHFDTNVPFAEAGLQAVADFYNANAQWHGGKLEAVLPLRSMPSLSAAVLDFDHGISERLREYPWEADTSILPSLFYQPGRFAVPAPVIIQDLCDVVSKNGNLLLNISPRADGSLPQDQQDILLDIGKWLKLNGEAIYGSRPFDVFGEGPTQRKSAREARRPFTVGDIRFTTKGGVVYAITFSWPGKQLAIKSLATGRRLPFSRITQISMLGDDKPLPFTRDASALIVELPSNRPCDNAYVLKIVGK